MIRPKRERNGSSSSSGDPIQGPGEAKQTGAGALLYGYEDEGDEEGTQVVNSKDTLGGEVRGRLSFIMNIMS